MAVCCDLEVDVNGEETFMVDKKIISSYSGRLSKLFGKSTSGTKSFKVLFNDFPGGAESFELMLKFCYNNGRVDINPSNLSLLHSAAKFMEMSSDSPSTASPNLLEQTEKSLQQISYWTWSELLVTLKQCQDLYNSSSIVEKCMDLLIGRMALSSESSPCPSTSSQDSSGTVRVSCDSRSTESLKACFVKGTWWFEEISGLSLSFIEMLIKAMASKKFDHGTISRFLFYYQKSKCYSTTGDEKLKTIEVVIDLLHILDWNSIPCKSLFGLLRVAMSLNVSKCSRKKVENMIGSQLDQATLDNLLIPSPHGTNCLYDVNLVLRFLKSFLHGGIYSIRLKKVASLMDMYIAEVAPDPSLKPSKFLALAMALPDSARDSYNQMYRAIDMYLEVHGGLSDEEKMKICCALNYEKLSAEVCMHISQNKKFPSRTATQALMSQQVKLKNLLQPTNAPTTCFVDSPCSSLGEADQKGKKNDEQIVLYAAKLDFSADNERLRAHLQGMQWRVMELEKVCRKMQTQMTKMMKSKTTPNRSNSRSLPKLCS